MINLRLLSRFVAQMLIVVLPLLGLVFLCSLTTALLAEEIQALDRLGTWQFWAAVGLGVLLGALALVAAYLLAARWVQAIYGLQSLNEGRGFVERQLFGLKGFAPWFRIEGGALSEPETHVLRQVGGPGNMVVSLDSAALLERAGILTEIVVAKSRDKRPSKGKTQPKNRRPPRTISQPTDQLPQLKPFERVFAALDLRPRRQVVSVSGLSYEGIPVSCDLEVHCHLARRPSEKPAGTPTAEKGLGEWKQKLFMAATSTWVREAYHGDERTLDWGERLVGVVMGALRGQLAVHRLDELVGLAGVRDPEDDDKVVDARTLIREAVQKAMEGAAPELGVDSSEHELKVELGDIRVTDAVTQQWIDRCKAQWTRRAAEHHILGKARRVDLVEQARTKAIINLLENATGMLKGLTDDERKITSKLVLSRLFMVLSSESGGDSLTRVYLPREAVNTMNEIKKLLL